MDALFHLFLCGKQCGVVIGADISFHDRPVGNDVDGAAAFCNDRMQL